MSDEFDVFYLDGDETQEVINWAVSSAAVVTLMMDSPPPSDTEEALDYLSTTIEALGIIWENIPDVIKGPAAAVATESLAAAIDEENQVAELREALKDL